MLDGYAANNATAKSIIEKYKDRVLDNYKEESEVAADLSDPFAGDLEAEVTGEIPVGAPAPAAADVLPVPTDAEAAEFVCEKCGAPVTKLQRDVSQLFNRKVLCKNCMK